MQQLLWKCDRLKDWDQSERSHALSHHDLIMNLVDMQSTI